MLFRDEMCVKDVAVFDSEDGPAFLLSFFEVGLDGANGANCFFLSNEDLKSLGGRGMKLPMHSL